MVHVGQIIVCLETHLFTNKKDCGAASTTASDKLVNYWVTPACRDDPRQLSVHT